MKRIKQILSILGPGFITGASDDDPSGIATYSQTGALFGFKQLWTAPLSLPFMITVQEMCARIAIVTGAGLTKNIKTHLHKSILFVAIGLLFIANTINIGANLGAMAASAQLVVPLPFTLLLVAMVGITLYFVIFLSYKQYSRYLMYLTFSLFAYIITAFMIKLNWKEIFVSSFVPYVEFSKEYLLNVVATFGTTISPYLFFWQANQEVEELQQKNVERRHDGTFFITKEHIFLMRIDTAFGMFVSNLIMWFIMITAGATFFGHGITRIDSAAQAAQALKPFAGEAASLIFALGIIGTGLLTVPILSASAAYALSEMCGWPNGLNLKLKQGYGFYGTITLSILLGTLLNFLPIDSITLLYYSAAVNGIIAPPFIFIILKLANNKALMKEYRNSALSNTLGYATGVIMSIAPLLLILSYLM